MSISKNIQRLILTITLNLISLNILFSQIVVQGKVTDAGDRSLLENIQVKLVSSGETEYTDNQGNFNLIDGGIDYSNSPSLVGDIAVRGNELAWHYNTPVNIRIINHLGSSCYITGEVPEYGRFVLSELRQGNYFLQVKSDKGINTYALVSVAGNFMLSDFNKNYMSWNSESTGLIDTLVFSHSDYYTRKLPVTPNSNFLEVQLLKLHYDSLDYLSELLNRAAFDMLIGTPPSGHLGEVETVKIMYDFESKEIYYMNTRKHPNHYYFAAEFLNYVFGLYFFNRDQYNNTQARYLYPATINYYKSLDIYTFEFFSGDGATCEDVENLYYAIKESSFFGDNLFFYASNDSWLACNSIPTVSANELYEGQNYQALNAGETFGYLKKLEIKELDQAELTRYDIVLVNGIPNNIPVIAGIITTEVQTPLSHINVLSHNRGTPNMSLQDGFTNPILDSLIDRLIYLKVEYDKFIVRRASFEEANEFWSEHEPQEPLNLAIDSLTSGLVDLMDAGIEDIQTIGGKAANFAELIRTFEIEGELPPVPEHYFAIPFYYYKQHLSLNGIDHFISQEMASLEFSTNSNVRQTILQEVREQIIQAPLNPTLISLVESRLSEVDNFSAFRFRSSTNAEDLEDFNGAGLYDSFTGILDSDSQPIDIAIKRVWASLWNYPAFEEREYFRIDHSTCAMGVLVHRSFPDEDANGVAITRNPYNTNHGFVINTQVGENSIVDPEPGVMHDQIILYTYSLSGSDPFTYEYVSNSSLLPSWQEHVLTEDELYQLGNYLLDIKNYFYNYVYPCDCDFKNFGLDIEFKLDSSTELRKLYIKQVRPY